MTRHILPGVCALALAAPAAAQPRTEVVDQPDANGWTVRIAFQRDPGTTARAAHAWTRARAAVLAERVAQEFPADAVAGVRIEGKDGDGKIDPVRGPHPMLPDWPLLEGKFRTRTKATLSGLEKNLTAARDAYQKAQKETDDLVRPRTDIPADKEKALQQVYKNYNDRLDEIAKGLPGEPVQLPRLYLPDPPYLREHTRAWDEAKQDQYLAEKLEAELRSRETDLSRQRKDIEVLKEMAQKETDPAARQQVQQSLKDAEARYGRTEKELKEDRKAADEFSKAAENRVSALENRLADADRIPPGADAFASKGGATYTGDDTPKVYKTDKDGKPLPDDQQPAGYPKPFNPSDRLAADEKAVVEPSLRVKPLDRVPEKVTAGVYGKVVEVNKDSGAMAVQVDETGTRLQFLGINPEGVKEGSFVDPMTVIGSWKADPDGTEGSFRLTIRAVNRKNQFVPPGPVLNYGRQKPPESGSLRRPTPEVDPPPSDGTGKATLPDGNGKYEPNYKLTMDDGVRKGRGYGYDELRRKELGLNAKELVARRELERQREAADRQQDAAGLLKAKMKDADRDLETARNKIDAINKDSRQLLKRAQELADRQTELDQEAKDLKADKADLDREAARVKATQDNKQIDAFNKKVERHNEKADRLDEKYRKLGRQKKDVQDQIAAAQRDRKKAEGEEARAKREKETLQSDLRTAEAQAKTAQDAVQKRQTELQSLATERQKLQDQLNGLESKKDTDGKQ